MQRNGDQRGGYGGGGGYGGNDRGGGAPRGAPRGGSAGRGGAPRGSFGGGGGGQASGPAVSHAVVAHQNVNRPVRPGFGKRGNVIKLRANMYPLQFPDKNVHQYDLQVIQISAPKKDGGQAKKEECTIAPLNRIVIDQWKRADHSKISWWTPKHTKAASVAVYDGKKNMFTPSLLELPSDGYVFKMSVVEDTTDIERVSDFEIRMIKVQEINMERLKVFLESTRKIASVDEADAPLDAIMVLEVLLRHSPALRFTTTGNRSGGSFYSSEAASFLPAGLAVHHGWYQSVRTTDGQFASAGPSAGGATANYRKLLLNLDVAATAFYQTGPVAETLMWFFNKNKIQDLQQVFSKEFERKKVAKYLKGVNINITYKNAVGRRRYKIGGITSKPANGITIDVEGEKMTVEKYFSKTYNINLQYPWMPCITAGATGKVMIPFELCDIRPDQRHVGKVSDEQAAEMIKVTASKPAEREKRIIEGISCLHGDHDAALLNAWGVNITPKMVEVNARVLASPQVSFANNMSIRVSNGSWRIDEGKKFTTSATCCAWSIAVFGEARECSLSQINKFCEVLDSMLVEKGVVCHWPDDIKEIVAYQRNRGDIEGTLVAAEALAVENGRRAAAAGMKRSNGRKIDMILCIMMVRNTVYPEIKRYAETHQGVMTQCMLVKHVGAAKTAYCANIALKINVKLGGVNSHVDPATELPVLGAGVPTMIFGADVTHSPGPNGTGNSIAAVVASMDKRYTEYRASIRMQSGRKEIIEELQSMAFELMSLFRERAGGRCPERILFYRDGVSDGEMSNVVIHEVNAIKRAAKEMGIPDNKFAVTFLSVNKRHHVRFFASNPRDADRNGNLNPGIVHPFEFDFFLNSHAGLSGTSRSSHYHVLYDEIGFTPDSLQDLTYRLCYLYCRATKAVSIVPPAYYAHLVAARAKYHGNFGSDTESNLSGVSSISLSKVLDDISRSMYFV